MHRSFNRVLNKEATIYGFKVSGIIFASIGSIIAIIKLGMLWFVFGAVPGYMAGSIVSGYWSKGRLQKWLYWNSSALSWMYGKKLPTSWQRWFL